MASSYQERRLQQQPEHEATTELDNRDQQLLESLDEGQELSPDQAGRMAAQFGNSVLAALVGSQLATPGVDGVDLEEEETVELAEDLGEELDAKHELEAPSHGGGGAPVAPVDDGGGDDGDPWDVGHLFGGDDDDDEGVPTPTKRPPRIPRRSFKPPKGDPFADPDDDPELSDVDLDGLELALGPTSALGDAPRDGDALYRTVEAALTDPRKLGRSRIEVEDLIGHHGATDPVARPISIGRFLSSAARSRRARITARLLEHATGTLFPDASGYSAGVARLASLAVCAEAQEGGGARTDRAVALSLAYDCWPTTVAAARPMAQQGRLHAPEVIDTLLGERAPGRGHAPPGEPSVLGGRALSRLLPSAYIPEVPEVELGGAAPVESADPELDEFDAVLQLLATGTDPLAAHDPDRPLEPDVLASVLHAARYLMNAAGKAHVEAAASALAVSRVRPGAPVRGPLEVMDRALARLARSILRAGRRLERLKGQPRSSVDPAAVRASVHELRTARTGLLDLRTWTFESVAGALDA